MIHHCPFNWGFSKDYLPHQLFWRFESGRRCWIFVHQLDMILKWKRWKSHWLKIVFCQSMTELANCQLEFKIDSDPTRRQQFTHHQIFSSSWNIWRVVDFKPAIYYLKFCAKKLLSILQKNGWNRANIFCHCLCLFKPVVPPVSTAKVSFGSACWHRTILDGSILSFGCI